MIIEESVEIKAPLPVVWRVFSTMENWRSWNTVCENCCIVKKCCASLTNSEIEQTGIQLRT
jgi:hypothetical protein